MIIKSIEFCSFQIIVPKKLLLDNTHHITLKSPGKEQTTISKYISEMYRIKSSLVNSDYFFKALLLSLPPRHIGIHEDVHAEKKYCYFTKQIVYFYYICSFVCLQISSSLADNIQNEPTNSIEEPTVPELVPIKSRQLRILEANAEKPKTDFVPDDFNQKRERKVANSKRDHGKNHQKITRENVQEYLLKDLMEQEKALDEEIELEHDKETHEYGEKILGHDYVKNSLGHDYTGSMIDNIKQEPRDDLEKNDIEENMDQDTLNQDNDALIVRQEKDNSDNINIKIEPLDDIILYPDYEMSNVIIKEEKKDNLSNVFQVSKDIANDCQASTSIAGEVQDTVKEEPMDEFDYEDDIIVLNSENFTIEEHPLFKSNNECAPQELPIETDLSEFQEGIKNKLEPEIIFTHKNPSKKLKPELKISSRIKTQNKIFMSDVKIVSNKNSLKAINESKKIKTLRGRKVYKCNKCTYEGIFREFKIHTAQCRSARKFTKIINENEDELAKETLWDQYYCTKCNCVFFTLKKYILHFIAHSIKQGACPVCAITLPNVTSLGMHFVSHVKQSYTKNVQTMNEIEQLNNKNEQLVTEYEELMKRNEELLISNKKVINRNEKIIDGNIRLMNDDELTMEDDLNLLKQNKHFNSANVKLVASNVELNSRNDELKLKIDEANAIRRAVGPGVVYKCKTCLDKVLLRDSFRHFESHLTLELVPCKTEIEQLVPQTDEVTEVNVLSPDTMTQIISK